MASKGTTTKKRKSPFRVRCGNLVVTRSKNTACPRDWIPVWVEPPASLRMDRTFVGSQVRCQVKVNDETRYLQGLVVRVVTGTTVELLLNDASKAQGLQRTDVLNNTTVCSKSERRHYELEKKIQGENTAVVKIQLSGKWVMQTFVPKKWDTRSIETMLPTLDSMNEKRKTITLFIGDSNDTDAQQTNNWRFLAARFQRSWTIGQVLSIQTQQTGNSLAMVTIRPMLWPEQTQSGRQDYHGDNEVFVDADGESTTFPIEELLQVARTVDSELNPGVDDVVVAKLQYSRKVNVYASISDTIDPKAPHCHRCFVQGTLKQCQECRQQWWCETCWAGNTDTPPCCNACECCQCLENRRKSTRLAWKAQLMQYEDPLKALQAIETPIHFSLPPDFLEPWPLPSKKPCAKLLLPSKAKDYENTGAKRLKRKRKRSDSTLEPPPLEDYSVFRPTCARTDAPKKIKYRRRFDPSIPEDRPRNARDALKSRLLTERATPSTKQSKRAMRWNQRRLEHVVGKANTLDSKEEFLRFGRSAIHAWGVFAEKAINAEELLIEYRGELISNAVAERREIEYARSLGRDYMFRIDADQVCDATKQGNVARFINASCDPNCYTKIISFEGAKRIAIYAKKDISEGEELSYDYKFEPEYDPAKRIPCNCGAKDCRGFMNWDRRYVSEPIDITPDDTSLDQSSEGDGNGTPSRQIELSSTEYPTPTMVQPSIELGKQS